MWDIQKEDKLPSCGLKTTTRTVEAAFKDFTSREDRCYCACITAHSQHDKERQFRTTHR